jgi:cyclopropane-fatty-acyl-phospholipid synthase
MQRQKLELVCSKLRLEGSHRLLDLGCGWGGLALHAAASRGAHVTAVNLSRPQLTTLERRAGERGLRGRIDIVHGDLAEARGTFDRVAAIGVAEHMGRAGLATLFRVVEARLATGGIGLVHTIGSATTGGTDPWLERTIFPGSYVPTLSELVRASEDAGLRVMHVENLGTHYALTLRHWLRRFREHDDVVRRRYGERFRREWEMYLTMLVPTFELLSTGLYQLVVTKGAAALDPRDVRTHCGALHAPRGSA